jgi:hypothetical protein
MKTLLRFAALFCASTAAYAGCGSTFCSVNTHWDTQGLVNDQGLRMDVRYAYAKADTPMVGSRKVAKPVATDPLFVAPGTEVENQRTINQILNVDLDYTLNSSWGVALDVPLVMRDHSHQLSDPLAANVGYAQKSFSQLGDIRVVGNYKFDSTYNQSGSGIRFGLKLPTGSTTQEMVAGTLMEAGMQPGSGSTDAVMGAYYHQTLHSSPWGWFASGQFQTALTTRNGFRPGNDLALDVGANYALAPALTGLVQLNAHFKARDGGTAINVNTHTGGYSLNLSPGLSFAVAPKTKLYGFVQLPLYQYANANIDPALPFGQLTATWAMSVGLSHHF